MKDLFSKQAEEYAKYRPVYPQELYNFIFGHVTRFDLAWDCGTGNGQAAVALAGQFKRVIATDMSGNQIRFAKIQPNITYQVCPAEKTPFPSSSFDLVTVAQALHWFDFDHFYPELKRVLKPEGIFAAWSYGLARVDPKVDKVIDYLHYDILKLYWDPRRLLVDENYQTIPFPLSKFNTPVFFIEALWTFEYYVNYISKTWSAVQTYLEKNGSNPMDLIKEDIKKAWGNIQSSKIITWPVALLLGSQSRA